MVSAVPGRRNCGASPVYSGGVTQMSRLAAIAPGPPATLGAMARARRPRHSTPASTAPINSKIANMARSPHGSRAARPALGSPIRSRRVAASVRRRCACHNLAACESSGPLGRSASVCSGRCCSPLACSIRRRAANRSGTTILRNAAARVTTKAAPRPSRIVAWRRPGKSGRRSKSPSTRNTPSTPSAGQHAGHTRSHISAARARRSRIANGPPEVDGRSVMRHLASAPASRTHRRANLEWYPRTAARHSSAVPG